MGIFSFKSKKDIEIQSLKSDIIEANSHRGAFNPLFHISYDGEKNTGELGPVTKYHLDYNSLRFRSWKAYLDDEITQTVIKRYATWVIGSGLKLQSEPVVSVLQGEGIEIDPSFSKIVEDRFKLYSASRKSDYTGINNLNRLAHTIEVNALVGGDVLVIKRVKNGVLNYQLIDGSHIQTPFFRDEVKIAEGLGNIIKNGIEQNSKGEHIAFHVKTNNNLEFKRIPAKGLRTGKEMSFMVYGLRYRIDDNRGIPIVSTVLETLSKLDRYKEAVVGSAEERAKIVYQIIHEQFSTGENPLTKNMAKAFNIDSEQDIPVDINNKQLADRVSASTNKETFNMPLGAKMEALDSKAEVNFQGFYSPLANMICATIGIPPEVAFSKYDSNFSASRAALKDWEHTLNVARKDFSFQVYQKTYNSWLELQILTNKIQAPGYINALANKDDIILEAYQYARFVGANVPHIDPEKEVRAERAKLGDSGISLPLTTAEAATESLNGGDYDSNVIKYSMELNQSKELGVQIQETQNIDTNGEETE